MWHFAPVALAYRLLRRVLSPVPPHRLLRWLHVDTNRWAVAAAAATAVRARVPPRRVNSTTLVAAALVHVSVLFGLCDCVTVPRVCVRRSVTGCGGASRQARATSCADTAADRCGVDPHTARCAYCTHSSQILTRWRSRWFRTCPGRPVCSGTTVRVARPLLLMWARRVHSLAPLLPTPAASFAPLPVDMNQVAPPSGAFAGRSWLCVCVTLFGVAIVAVFLFLLVSAVEKSARTSVQLGSEAGTCS